MGSYAQGLLKKQPFLRARERVLMTWIESAVTEYPKEKDVICKKRPASRTCTAK